MKKAIKNTVTIVFGFLFISGITACNQVMYKSPLSGDLVPVTFWATDLNKRNVFYTDELVVVQLIDSSTEKYLGFLRLEYTDPKQRIDIMARKPVTLLFAEVDPHIGYTVECIGELEFNPEAQSQYVIEYDFIIKDENSIYKKGDCYAKIIKKMKSGKEKVVKRKNFDIVTKPL